MERISEHVWWLLPGPPDRPSLCAVVGESWTLALDAGSSRAHTRAFLDGLPARPSAVVYTHAHWDHVFGGVEIAGIVIAQAGTAERLQEMARRDQIALADVVFDETIDFDLGGVAVRVEHVGGDHCDDACVAFVEPDRVLFLGDCLCGSPAEDALTTAKAFPLYDRVLAFDARHVVEGHHPAVTSRTELEQLIAKARDAANGVVIQGDEGSEYFAHAFAV